MSEDEHTKRFYDATAEEVAAKWYPEDVLMPTIRQFLSYLPPGPRVLDLGCGPGHESMRLASAGAKVFGVDFSDECIRIARERCPQCRFGVMDFRQLDTSFGRFHGVFAAGSIIHVSPDELPQVMSRIASVLEDGGRLLALVQDGEGSREHRHVIGGHEFRRIVYLYRPHDLATATSHLTVCGEVHLADELFKQGWRAHLLGLRNGVRATE